jgi:hypothetical protein
MASQTPILINKDIVDLQDIEKIQFIQSLQADPAVYHAYIDDKKGRIIEETIDTKRASFAKLTGNLGKMMDMDHNSLVALNRTQDLTATQDQIIQNQSKEYGARIYNRDMTRRQVEINNWYYENKRETLFLLQFTLLVVLFIVIVLGVQYYEFISSEGANFLIGFALMAGGATWGYRWWYTNYTRDPAFWSKRHFAGDAAGAKATSTAPTECATPLPS